MVLRLRYAEEERFTYRPGQFVGLDAVDGRQRFFSIANAEPVGNELELHVSRVPGGVFTSALFDTAEVGDTFWMEGPFGDFSIPLDVPPKIIVVAGGTGFAPIRACLEQMAAHNAPGANVPGANVPGASVPGASVPGAAARPTIPLYWGARSHEDLYDLASVGALCERLPALRFIPVLDHAGPSCSVRTGFVHRAVIEDFESLSEYEIYACGAPAMIEALSRECAAERGFDPSRLTADAFVSGPDSDDLTPAGAGSPVEVLVGGRAGVKAIAGFEGEALLFALRRAGVELPSVCGGKGACGTCRIRIAPAWQSRIAEPAKREARLLQYIGAEQGDRLSCRILLATALGGLEIHTCADVEGEMQ